MAFQDLGGGCFVMAGTAEQALVNVSLVLGSERALVVDTGCGPRHGAEILAAVREVTALPLIAVNTHAHWDHFFGNAYFAAAGVSEIWAHPAAAGTMASTGERQRAEVAGCEPEMAAGRGPWTELHLPTHLVQGLSVCLDLGGAGVELFFLGRGHTDGDLLIGTSTGVLFAGDLLEEGAPPQYDDAYPAEWAAALRELGTMGRKYPVMVPGHGKAVTAEFAAGLAEMVSRQPG